MKESIANAKTLHNLPPEVGTYAQYCILDLVKKSRAGIP
jgi:hypothetical protein